MLDNKKIGKTILTLRKQLELTQAELSDMLGVSHQAVSKWEQGECLPDIEVLLRLAKVFKKSVEELLLSEPVMNEEATAKDADQGSNVDNIWAKTLEAIREKISLPSYNTWFKDTYAKREGEVLIIYSPNDYATEWMYSRYSTLIANTLDNLMGDTQLNIEFRTSTKAIHDRDQSRATINLEAT